ncbi:hypothetical protein PF007_g31967 [Phytophthora fragariae]|nr:hypothetical protein PF011_g28668 [Phytophthora fragariae]KAE9056506.1 hypothetical protein PF007_g31967 [Phytophthora fragariae]KAE9267987.1 hypothetical protein PF008_g31225 [Phytophthora fragariae]
MKATGRSLVGHASHLTRTLHCLSFSPSLLVSVCLSDCTCSPKAWAKIQYMSLEVTSPFLTATVK